MFEIHSCKNTAKLFTGHITRYSSAHDTTNTHYKQLDFTPQWTNRQSHVFQPVWKYKTCNLSALAVILCKFSDMFSCRKSIFKNWAGSINFRHCSQGKELNYIQASLTSNHAFKNLLFKIIISYPCIFFYNIFSYNLKSPVSCLKINKP